MFFGIVKILLTFKKFMWIVNKIIGGIISADIIKYCILYS